MQNPQSSALMRTRNSLAINLRMRQDRGLELEVTAVSAMKGGSLSSEESVT